jgi:hypothetical protein
VAVINEQGDRAGESVEVRKPEVKAGSCQGKLTPWQVNYDLNSDGALRTIPTLPDKDADKDAEPPGDYFGDSNACSDQRARRLDQCLLRTKIRTAPYYQDIAIVCTLPIEGFKERAVRF